MILSGLAALIGLVIPSLGQLLAYLAYPFAAYTIRVVEWLASFNPWDWYMQRINPFWIILYYLILAVLLFKRDWLTKLAVAWKPSLAIGGVSLAAVLVWMAILQRPDGNLHILLPGAQPSSALVLGPGGGSLVVNGGASANSLQEMLGRNLPFYRQQLDGVLLLSGKNTEIGGLSAALLRHPPGWLGWGLSGDPGRTGLALQSLSAEKGWTVLPVTVGDTLDLRRGARLEVLAVNKDGYAWSIQWQDFRMFVLKGAVAGADWLPAGSVWVLDGVSGDTRASIIGSSPQLVITSEIFIAPGITILHPADHKLIELVSDGKTMQVRVE
jgi:hypothetical protein